MRFRIVTPVVLATLIFGLPTTLAAETSVTYQGLHIQSTQEQAADWAARYDGAASHKASAMAIDESGEWAMGFISAQPGSLPAVGQALQGCERDRQLKGIEAPCELVRVNDNELELGRAFANRMNVTDTGRPANVWRFEAGDSVVLLAGTIHALKPTLYPLAPAYEQSFDAADELVVEVNINDISPQRMMMLRNEYLVLPNGQRLGDVMPDSDLALAQEAMAELGIPWNAVETFKPAVLAVELAQAVMMLHGALPQYGIDLHYMQRAAARGLPISELETVELQMELLSRAPMDLQSAETTGVIALMRDAGDMFNELLEAWYDGDLDTLDEVMRREQDGSPELAAWYSELLEERNIGMAERIAQMLDGESRTRLVLVGAGHVAGDGSILELLERKGFTGQRLRRDGTPF